MNEDWIDEVLHVLVWPILFIIGAAILSGLGSFIFQHEYRSGILYLLGAGVAYLILQVIERYFNLKEVKKHE
jgi:positive regulator of sigma E activity